MKVLIHVQHLLGTGHQRRAGAIAVALARSGAEVVYVTGGMPDPGHQAGLSSFSNIKLVQLAPARAGDLRYSHLVDRFGRPASDEWRNARKAHLLSVFRDERPDALVVETFPFGRKLLEFELLPLMDAAVAARPRPLLVCSVRDIIEPRDNMDRYRRMLDQAMRYIDCVLVHSDPAIVPLGASFPFARDLDQRLWYTGFVTSARSRTKVVLSEGRGEVVVSAGGGAVGRCLYRTAMGARQLLGQAYGPGRNLPGRHLMSRTTWRILAGVPKPARLAASLTSPVSIMARGFTPPRANAGSLAGASSHGIVIEPNREDFPSLLGRAKVSVSQAGYNTLLDVLAAGCRSVVVPYAAAGQQEQGIRARLFQSLGLVRVLSSADLGPSALARQVAFAACGKPPPPVRAKLDGAEHAANIIRAQISARRHQ